MKPPTPSPSYLIRNQYSYCFRMKVPPDIQVVFGKKELRYSLRTGYLRQAKQHARLFAGLVQKLFTYLRSFGKTMNLTDEDIQEIIEVFKEFALDTLVTNLRSSVGSSVEASEVFGKIHSKSVTSEVGLVAGDCSPVALALDTVLEGMQYDLESDIDKNSSQYKELCRTLLRLSIQQLEQAKEQLDTEFHELELGRRYGQKVRKETLEIPEFTTLKILLDEYWKRRQGGWAAAALESYDRYKNRLLDHFGMDRPINTIDYKAMEQFRDKLKETGNRGKPIADKTVNLHLEFYSGVFNHAIQSGRINHNPLGGVKFADKRDQQSLNDPFTKGDLSKLFGSKEYNHDTFINGWMFWLPVLSLYTGARLEELCQLYIDEIKLVDDIWVLDIDETRPDQSVKAHEKRYIPLHPFITEELNFIQYAHSLPNQNGRLFPELIAIGKRQRYGHGPSSNWFPGYKKRCGIVAPARKKTIHSFRHNVASCLMEQDIQEYVIAMLLGHKHPQISAGRYGKKFEADMLMEKAVLKLDYRVDLSHLKKSKYVIKKS